MAHHVQGKTVRWPHQVDMAVDIVFGHFLSHLIVFKGFCSKWLWSIVHTHVSLSEGPIAICEEANVMLIYLCLQVLCRSKNSILKECFLVAELENRRRSPTVSG